MVELNDISFHDAVILDVRKEASKIIFELEAVQYGKEGHTYTGYLCFDNIQTIKKDGQLVNCINKCYDINKYYDDGEILEVDIKNNICTISVIWESYKDNKRDFSEYEIISSNIYWQEIGVFE
jgi:hypothetical protein